MTTTVREFEEEVFQQEGVKIHVMLPPRVQLPVRYVQLFKQPLADTARLQELQYRLDRCLGEITYGVHNPLGCPARVSSFCVLGALRACYRCWPPVGSGWARNISRLFGEKVLQRARQLARSF